MQKFLRGQIWFYNDPNNCTSKYASTSSVQRGSRPVVIVSNDIGNKNSPVITVVPCTTQSKSDIPTHFNFILDATPNTVLCEQIFTVGKADLVTYRGTLEDSEISMLNRCLAAALLLNEPQIIIKPVTPNQQLSERICDTINPTVQSVSTTPQNDQHTEQLREKRKYIKRTELEKQEIITAYMSVAKKEELEELARRYNFTTPKMLEQSVDRWTSK